ncbi:hypothetical protein BJ165DRAFT_1407671 [Panaeolus papilionaceus]|nr:hypothetical protein BJ165DRAFT_1407671 [Panaeolus papilionaceus]
MEHPVDQRDFAPDSITVQHADPPFDLPNARGADLILRSTDNVNFYVSSALISFSCPKFHEVIANNSTSNKDQGSHDVLKCPVIEVQASMTALYYILHFVYPVGATPLPDKSIDGIKARAEAALQSDPYRVLVLARKHGWEDLERRAVLETFGRPTDDIPLFPELAVLTGIDFRRILKHRAACSRNLALASPWDSSTAIGISSLVSPKATRPGFVRKASHKTKDAQQCTTTMDLSNRYSSVSVPSWFKDYRSNVMELLERFPHPQTLDSAEAKKLIQKMLAVILETCPTCTLSIVSIQDDINSWLDHLKDEVEQLISKVEVAEGVD